VKDELAKAMKSFTELFQSDPISIQPGGNPGTFHQIVDRPCCAARQGGEVLHPVSIRPRVGEPVPLGDSDFFSSNFSGCVTPDQANLPIGPQLASWFALANHCLGRANLPDSEPNQNLSESLLQARNGILETFNSQDSRRYSTRDLSAASLTLWEIAVALRFRGIELPLPSVSVPEAPEKVKEFLNKPFLPPRVAEPGGWDD
jgi:hypothetical protein